MVECYATICFEDWNMQQVTQCIKLYGRQYCTQFYRTYYVVIHIISAQSKCENIDVQFCWWWPLFTPLLNGVTGKTYMLAILAIEYFKFDLIFWVIDFVLSNKASSSQGVSADDLSQHHYLPMIEHFNCHVLFYVEFCGHCVTALLTIYIKQCKCED